MLCFICFVQLLKPLRTHVRKSSIPKYLLGAVFFDTALVALGLGLAYFIRFNSGLIAVTKGYTPAEYARLYPFAVAIWIFSYFMVHLYQPEERFFSYAVLFRILKGSSLAIVTLIAMNFFLREAEYSRLVYVMSFVVVIGVTAVGRLLGDRYLSYLKVAKGWGVVSAIILGTGPLAELVARKMATHPQYGWRLIGFVGEGKDKQTQKVLGGPVLGTRANLVDIIKQHKVEAVFVAAPDFPHEELENLLLECEKEHVEFRIIPDQIELLFTQLQINTLNGVPCLALRETPLHGWNAIVKRTVDLVGASALLVILSPLILVIHWMIRRESPGSVFYRQERIGIDGRRFQMIKFRSMVPTAEEETGPIFAKANDPRCTPVGRILRAHNLDEIPQLFNVIRGDMSLVGPRPERPHFVSQFKENIPRYMARHKVKSGLTGWAQVNGLRGDCSIPERLKYDLYYIENWNIWFDLKILAMTLLGANQGR
ncbi:MAG: undecaprenyl-phosphate glucose phosphotransferase [bacterium]